MCVCVCIYNEEAPLEGAPDAAAQVGGQRRK